MALRFDPAAAASGPAALAAGRGAELAAAGRDGDVRGAAEQFEAVLLQQLVAAMRKTATLGNEEASQNQLVDHLIDEALAGHLARAGGIGLADLIARDAAGPGAGGQASPPSVSPSLLPAARPAPTVDPSATAGLAIPADPRGLDAAPRGGEATLTSSGPPRPGSLAASLPPDADPWLHRPDAAAILERVLRFGEDATSDFR